MAAGWRRSKIRGSRPGNFSKLSTGGTLDFEDEEEENETDWASSKDKDSHTSTSINHALRASLEQIVTNSVKNSSTKNSKSISKNKRLSHLNGLVKL